MCNRFKQSTSEGLLEQMMILTVALLFMCSRAGCLAPRLHCSFLKEPPVLWALHGASSWQWLFLLLSMVLLYLCFKICLLSTMQSPQPEMHDLDYCPHSATPGKRNKNQILWSSSSHLISCGKGTNGQVILRLKQKCLFRCLGNQDLRWLNGLKWDFCPIWTYRLKIKQK